MPGKRVQFDEETWAAIEVLAQDTMADFQELADEAFRGERRDHFAEERDQLGARLHRLLTLHCRGSTTAEKFHSCRGCRDGGIHSSSKNKSGSSSPALPRRHSSKECAFSGRSRPM